MKDFAGICIKEAESLQSEQKVELVGQGRYTGRKGSCSVWRDMVTSEGAEVLYSYSDRFYSENACITVNNYKKGRVYYVGGGADPDTLNLLASEIADYNGIYRVESADGLEVCLRTNGQDRWHIICNHTDSEIQYGGTTYRPYESRIIKL